MAKGENIFRRRDGRWEARYSKGRELSGKIKYGYCYGKTYREAKEKAEKCKAALASGNPLPTSRTPNLFSAYCMGWLHAKKSKVKESTYITRKIKKSRNDWSARKPGLSESYPFPAFVLSDGKKQL